MLDLSILSVTELEQLGIRAKEELARRKAQEVQKAKERKEREAKEKREIAKMQALATHWWGSAKRIGKTPTEVLASLNRPRPQISALSKIQMVTPPEPLVDSRQAKEEERLFEQGVWYRDPANPETRWRGWARRPAWFLRCRSRGLTLEQLKDPNQGPNPS